MCGSGGRCSPAVVPDCWQTLACLRSIIQKAGSADNRYIPGCNVSHSDVERRKEPTLFCSAGGSRSGAQSSALLFGSSRCS